MNIFTDGVFDIFHYGHANALRQAKLLGERLIVGVNSSASARHYKNNPVLSDSERLHVLQSCRWVDEVIPDAPYFLDFAMVKSLECGLVVHGDDEIIDVYGNHCYAAAKKANQYVQFERTRGISTSELVGRLLYKDGRRIKVDKEMDEYHDKLIELFDHPRREKEGVVVYIDGSFDLYHAGHVSLIEEARRNGDYLIAGLHNDEDIDDLRREGPIMRQKERKLCLLSNKHVDEVVDDAPFYPSVEFLEKLGVNVIYCGKESIYFYYSVMDHFKVVGFENQFSYLSCNTICERIILNYNEYIKKADRNKIV